MANENAGKQWSEDEIKKLQKLADDNTPTGIMALKLKRSEDAIRAKAHQQNISLKPVNKPPYDRNVANQKKKGR